MRMPLVSGPCGHNEAFQLGMLRFPADSTNGFSGGGNEPPHAVSGFLKPIFPEQEMLHQQQFMWRN
jgi:hypothetical protein